MKKLFFVFCVALETCNEIFAQASYMHEAAEDAVGWNGNGALSTILTIVVSGLFLIIFIPLMIHEKIDNSKFEKKYKQRKRMLENEAENILTISAESNGYHQYSSNPAWKKWFIDGYLDGVLKDIIGPISPKEYETFDWETPAKRHLESVRKELLGGSIDMSLSAYKAGYLEGLRRKDLINGEIEL